MSNTLSIQRFVVGAYQQNCYLLSIPGQQEAVCIDPGDEVAVIKQFADEHQLIIKKILLTHGHWDHMNAVGSLQALTKAQVYLHNEDLFLYESNEDQAQWLGGTAEELPSIDHYVVDGDCIEEGELTLRVIHTPGHSPGGVCYQVGEHCFVGDTIFLQSVGRTDLPGGDQEQLFTSIQTKLLALPDNTMLYPGHGEPTTVGDERELNPFLQHLS